MDCLHGAGDVKGRIASSGMSGQVREMVNATEGLVTVA